MSAADSPNQTRPLTGSIPAVRPIKAETSCTRWYSAQIWRECWVSASVQVEGDMTRAPRVWSMLPAILNDRHRNDRESTPRERSQPAPPRPIGGEQGVGGLGSPAP